MTLPTFICQGELPQPGQRFEFAGPEARHAATVKRLGVGEELALVDGRGGESVCTIVEVVAKDRLVVESTSLSKMPPREPSVTVVQALPKSDRSELSVDLATQAGAERIIPWAAARCIAKWPGNKAEKGRAKWEAAAQAAAKQCRRPVIPVIEPLAGTPAVAAEIQRVTAAGGVAVVLHETATASIREVDFTGAKEILLIVGPEGSLAPEELEVFAAAGAQTVLLGPEVLRTACAAMVGLAAIGVLTDRW